MIQKIKGTMDLFPKDTALFRHIEGIMREEAARYGYGEIRTPTFENTDLFVRGVGEGTDVVQKEMYTFADRDENRSISLRPEITAPVVRALIEHGKFSDPLPQKYYYIGSCFRHEAPQAGRSREFFQFGTEMFGAATPAADAATIALAASVLRRLGLKTVKLHLNSIGCSECRPAYRDALVRYFSAHEAELCDTCKTRLQKNPLRLLDCKSPVCSEIAKGAPRTTDHLCGDCKDHFDTLQSLLVDMDIPFILDTGIVRGLDYYTRTVFEFIAEGIAAQSTVCGGGRYDSLVPSLGGPAMPAVGFGMGITRVILALHQEGIEDPAIPCPTLYIAALGALAQTKAAALVESLRRKGVYAEFDTMGRSLKAQMKYAGKLGARYVLLLGENELQTGIAPLRDMAESTQRDIEISNIENEI